MIPYIQILLNKPKIINGFSSVLAIWLALLRIWSEREKRFKINPMQWHKSLSTINSQRKYCMYKYIEWIHIFCVHININYNSWVTVAVANGMHHETQFKSRLASNVLITSASFVCSLPLCVAWLLSQFSMGLCFSMVSLHLVGLFWHSFFSTLYSMQSLLFIFHDRMFVSFCVLFFCRVFCHHRRSRFPHTQYG